MSRKKILFIFMILSFLLIVFGILLLINYALVMQKGSVFIGLLFIGSAVYFLIKYILNKKMRKTFDMNLLFMSFCILFGFLFILMPEYTETLFKAIIGLIMISMSIVYIESLYTRKPEGTKISPLVFVLIFVCLIMGIGVTFNIMNLIKGNVFGILLIVYGLISMYISLVVRMKVLSGVK